MPKRVIDFDAMWGSTKIALCSEWVRPYYAWLYGLADANGSFEMTDLRVVWGKVTAILPNLGLSEVGKIFSEFERNGLLFTWTVGGKRYGHWTKSDLPGRLPAASHRLRRRQKLFAPMVPARELRLYLQRFDEKELPCTGLGLGLGLGIGESKDQKQVAQATPSRFAFEGTHLKISEGQDRLLAEAFPWIDRKQEYRKMDSWCEANPKKRPKSYSKFAHNWFQRIDPPGVRDDRAKQRTQRNVDAAGRFLRKVGAVDGAVRGSDGGNGDGAADRHLLPSIEERDENGGVGDGVSGSTPAV